MTKHILLRIALLSVVLAAYLAATSVHAHAQAVRTSLLPIEFANASIIGPTGNRLLWVGCYGGVVRSYDMVSGEAKDYGMESTSTIADVGVLDGTVYAQNTLGTVYYKSEQDNTWGKMSLPEGSTLMGSTNGRMYVYTIARGVGSFTNERTITYSDNAIENIGTIYQSFMYSENDSVYAYILNGDRIIWRSVNGGTFTKFGEEGRISSLLFIGKDKFFVARYGSMFICDRDGMRAYMPKSILDSNGERKSINQLYLYSAGYATMQTPILTALMQPASKEVSRYYTYNRERDEWREYPVGQGDQFVMSARGTSTPTGDTIYIANRPEYAALIIKSGQKPVEWKRLGSNRGTMYGWEWYLPILDCKGAWGSIDVLNPQNGGSRLYGRYEPSTKQLTDMTEEPFTCTKGTGGHIVGFSIRDDIGAVAQDANSDVISDKFIHVRRLSTNQQLSCALSPTRENEFALYPTKGYVLQQTPTMIYRYTLANDTWDSVAFPTGFLCRALAANADSIVVAGITATNKPGRFCSFDGGHSWVYDSLMTMGQDQEMKFTVFGSAVYMFKSTTYSQPLHVNEWKLGDANASVVLDSALGYTFTSTELHTNGRYLIFKESRPTYCLVYDRRTSRIDTVDINDYEPYYFADEKFPFEMTADGFRIFSKTAVFTYTFPTTSDVEERQVVSGYSTEGCHIFPNPTTGTVNIRFDVPQVEPEAHVTIVDQVGRTVYDAGSVSVNEQGIYTIQPGSAVANGKYYVVLDNSTQRIALPMVVVR